MAKVILKIFVCVLWISQSVKQIESNSDEICYLPDGCQFIDDLIYTNRANDIRGVRILCKHLNTHFDEDRLEYLYEMIAT